jgi:hypothetical protein
MNTVVNVAIAFAYIVLGLYAYTAYIVFSQVGA